MHDNMGLTRRSALLGAAALPLAATFGTFGPRPAAAKAAFKGAGMTPYHRFMLGDYEITTLLAGSRPVDNPHTIFGLNASEEEFRATAAAAFLPNEVAQFFFTPTLVNTGEQVVLFDTGLNAEGITAALAAAGYAPGDVDTVVLTHMHGDHIGGLMQDGKPTFANAGYVAGATEHNHWMAAANEGFDANVRPLNDRMGFLDDGGVVAPGIEAIFAPGHTPGHLAFRVESGGHNLVLIADTANHHVFSLAHPDWEVRFDADKAQAAATRRSLLGMIASERLPFVGYHMPFPATGFVETSGEDFRYVPASYQLML